MGVHRAIQCGGGKKLRDACRLRVRCYNVWYRELNFACTNCCPGGMINLSGEIKTKFIDECIISANQLSRYKVLKIKHAHSFCLPQKTRKLQPMLVTQNLAKE